MNRNREVRELQFSSTQLIVLFLAILILGIFIFLLGVSVGKKQTRLTQEANLVRKPLYQTVKPFNPTLAKESQPNDIDKELASHAQQSGPAGTPNPTDKGPASSLPGARPATPGTPLGSPRSTAPLTKPAATETQSATQKSLPLGTKLTTTPSPAKTKTEATPAVSKPAPKTETAGAKTTAASRLVTNPSGTPATTTPAARTAVPVKGYYYIQLAAFDEKTEAEAYAADVRAAGFPTLVLDPLSTDRKPWYRVRVGGFLTKDEAEKTVYRLKSALNAKRFEYWITRG